MAERPDPLAKLRWSLYASDLLVLLAGGLIALVHHPHWTWSRVVWGAAIGLIAVGVQEVPYVLGIRLLRPDAEQASAVRARRLSRRSIVGPGLLVACGSVGLIAAALDSPAIDVALTVGVVLMFLMSVTSSIAVARRVGRKGLTPRSRTETSDQLSKRNAD